MSRTSIFFPPGDVDESIYFIISLLDRGQNQAELARKEKGDGGVLWLR